MVPEAGALESNSYANTLLAKSPLHPMKRFPIPQYRPRDGRGPGRDDWEHSLGQLCTALGITVASLDDEPPTPASSPYSVTPAMRRYFTDKLSEANLRTVDRGLRETVL